MGVFEEHPHFNFMKAEYSEDIDREIIFEANTKGKKLSNIFGFHFEEVTFDSKRKNLAMHYIGDIDKEVVVTLKEVIFGIFKRNFPKVSIFINITPFSTWNTKKCYISLSVDRFPDKILSSLCHEANHFMYDEIFGSGKYEDTCVKESLTILQELFGVRDYGWKTFEKQRGEIVSFFKKNQDIHQTVSFAKSILYENAKPMK